MSLESAMQPIEFEYVNDVLKATWGHLAPKKDKEYRGQIVWTISLYEGQNPVPMIVDFGDLPDSPWMYEAVNDLLLDIKEVAGCEVEPGNVYRWRGTFKNYKFIQRTLEWVWSE